MKLIKSLIYVLLSLLSIFVFSVYFILRASLPNIDTAFSTQWVQSDTRIGRDTLGNTKITADKHLDAVFALGYAHAQDRLFQMDLLRRSAAGELSEIVGEVALSVDKKARFHQFRQRASNIFGKLPINQQRLLKKYALGVNMAAKDYTALPFEYFLTGADFKPWLPEDSLLVSFSMYLDLQGNQVERDLVNTIIVEKFGFALLNFFNLPSPYQAALDGSIISADSSKIPSLNTAALLHKQGELIGGLLSFDSIPEPLDIGSNNWAVTNQLTHSDSAMLSDDMHLGLRVPPIWYRAQLNYTINEQPIKVSGVTLPGTPAVIVGSNGAIAWGFTNANLDNVDWIALDDTTQTKTVTEIIKTKTSEEIFEIEMSEYGPVRTVNGIRYALAWVAHQDYAVNMTIADMAGARNLNEAFSIAQSVRLPVQNLMLADAAGNAGWRPIGAVSARVKPSLYAISEQEYSPLWLQPESTLPRVINPSHGRLWTANARVVSAEDFKRFGDGGYAVGARGLQIRDRLFAQDMFSEQDFYDIQLDNEARFLTPWHTKLLNVLSKAPETYSKDLAILRQWKNCACPESIGYTLARRFRSTVINSLLSPVNKEIEIEGFRLSTALRSIEPAIWQILDRNSPSWLPKEFASYDAFLLAAYENTKRSLINRYDADPATLVGLEWGNVNTLKIKHPFASQLGPFAGLLNMPAVEGFGDSYMPAVQAATFGASQRFIVKPGDEVNAILTIPGGQSGHPLSAFYSAGFDAYANAETTSLLPSKIESEILISPIR